MKVYRDLNKNKLKDKMNVYRDLNKDKINKFLYKKE